MATSEGTYLGHGCDLTTLRSCLEDGVSSFRVLSSEFTKALVPLHAVHPTLLYHVCLHELASKSRVGERMGLAEAEGVSLGGGGLVSCPRTNAERMSL